MRTRPTLPLALLLAATLCLHSATAAAGLLSEDYSGMELSADLITAFVPFAAYGVAHYRKEDSKGESQFLRSVGVSLLLNSSLRYALKSSDWSTRPNGSPYGFPSGHTAFMTSSAAFLQDRYGWKYGVPAYVLTAYVAWVRVDTDHHRWRDVIAGAALSYTVSKFFVTPFEDTRITPIVGPDSLGLRVERTF